MLAHLKTKEFTQIPSRAVYQVCQSQCRWHVLLEASARSNQGTCRHGDLHMHMHPDFLWKLFFFQLCSHFTQGRWCHGDLHVHMPMHPDFFLKTFVNNFLSSNFVHILFREDGVMETYACTCLLCVIFCNFELNSNCFMWPTHARATRPGSEADVKVQQYAGPLMGGSYLSQSCIWVSFCRAGKIAVLCHFFSLRRAFVWPNHAKWNWFFDWFWLIGYSA